MNNDEWFSNPLDSMPIATDKGEYITDEYAPCDVEYDLENPDESDEIEASKKHREKISSQRKRQSMSDVVRSYRRSGESD